MSLYLSGSAKQDSDVELLTRDQLEGMGSAITSDIGSLAWCEAYAIGKAMAAALNFIKLMSNQLSPHDMSIYATRFAAIYDLAAQGNGLLPSNLKELQIAIGLREARFGTVPNESAVTEFVSALLGPSFIGLDYMDPHVQVLATVAPLATGELWFSPLSTLFIRIWQPRDNQDNLLMSDGDFSARCDSYKVFLQAWMPANVAVISEQLFYEGNDGYGSYALGKNVINGSAGSHLITGDAWTAFPTDLALVHQFPANPNGGYDMPLEVVDDANELHTYHVHYIGGDNVSLTTLEPLVNNITNRRYRLLGWQLDTNMLDCALANQ